MSIEVTQFNKGPHSSKAKDIFIGRIIDDLEKKRAILPGKLVTKADHLVDILAEDNTLNLDLLKERCFYSIPDDISGLRSLCWKLILDYLPANRKEWESTLKTRRENYQNFIFEFLIPKAGQVLPAPKTDSKSSKTQAHLDGSPEEEEKHSAAQKKDALSRAKTDDHPLSQAVTSVWASYFEDYELWEMVAKDTKRTRAEMHFFQKPTQRSPGYDGASHKFVNMGKRSMGTTIYETNEETHNEVLQRILFIYAKLNKGISYVQGMNEILAPIYYCFSTDPNPLFADFAEADSFWCFTAIMSEIKDAFVRSLDSDDCGIKSRVASVHSLLSKFDDEIWLHFERHSVVPMYYCMRWVMLFMTQEFELDEVMTLWDSLLSHWNKMEFIEYLSVAILILKRDQLLAGDFPEILEAIRRIDDIDIVELIHKANELWDFMYKGPPKDQANEQGQGQADAVKGLHQLGPLESFSAF